jgi:Ca2+-binding RTX toxin-like protein
MDNFRFRVLGSILLLAVVIATGLTTTLAKETARPKCFGQPATIADHVGVINGTPGNDVIVGDNGVNEISGRGGHDRICGLGGNDLVFGDEGNDRISGGNGDDSLGGSADNDLVFGNQGADFLRGHDGDDTLVGGLGLDDLDGNAGVDVCHQGNIVAPAVAC